MATITKGLITDKIHGLTVDTSIKCKSTNYTNMSSRDVKYVVMHYTGNSADLARSNVLYFNSGDRSSSAHLFVDEENIYQSVELRDKAWHCGCSSGYKTACRNDNSIGIEMCCSGNYKIAEKTQIHAAYVCAYICKLIGITASNVDTYVLRHFDVVKSDKECPAPMVKDLALWKKFKTMVKNILQYGTHDNTIPTIPKLPVDGKTKYWRLGDGKDTRTTVYDITQIKNIQRCFNYLGIKDEDGKKLGINGYYGVKSKSCTEAFQKKYGLPVNGCFGNLCLEIMKDLIK